FFNNRPVPGNNFGVGFHEWVRYGYEVDPAAPLIFIPGVGNVHAYTDEWFKQFNPAPGQPGEGAYMSGTGYKFVVEPLGPESLDDGNGGIYSSLPAPAPFLLNPIDTPAEALAQAQAQLGLSGFLTDEAGLTGGNFDMSG